MIPFFTGIFTASRPRILIGLTSFLLAFAPLISFAQQIKYTIHGFVRDKQTGENLIGVGIYNPKTGQGTTTVETGLVSRLVTEALAGNRLVLTASVTAWQVRGRAGVVPALKISIQARHGACPRELADTAEQLVAGLDRILGHPVPVLVRITSGTRTRLARPDRAR